MTLFQHPPAAPAIQLRPYQAEAVEALFAWFEDHTTNPLIVAPTGAGKSVILTAFIREVLTQFPNERILVVTHVRELIQQNHDAMLRVWPEAPVGIWSAGLKRRDKRAQILFCGIQTVYAKAAAIEWADLILVDEAHLIPRDGMGMYRRFLDDLLAINSKVKVIGLTATPYRTDTGRLDRGPDAPFGGIAYDCDIVSLIEQGYLSKITNRGTAAAIDTRGVHRRGGEFIPAELEAAALTGDLVPRAVDEIVARAGDRKSWLLFCCGVDHATQVRDELRRRGIESECIFGKTPKGERDAIIERFRSGELRTLTNMNVLTTGFDAPNIDLIALLRPTCSPGLYVQMVGRGLRIAPGKTDCLVLDFGGNVVRHGPIDHIDPAEEGADDTEGVAPAKQCPSCMLLVPISVRDCPECGFEFAVLEPEKDPHDAKPIEDAPIIRGNATIERWDVRRVATAEHHKPDKPVSMRVEYDCGFNRYVREWVCFEHDGFARRKAEQWWRARGGHDPVPETVDQARVRIDFGELRPVLGITVDVRGEYPKLLGVRLGENEAGLNEEIGAHLGGPRPTDIDLNEIPF